MKWISVKDRLPEFNVQVLWLTRIKWENKTLIRQDSLMDYKYPVEFDGSFYCLRDYSDFLAYDGDYYDEIATHWQPLPEPPTV